jgi:transposase-like protein
MAFRPNVLRLDAIRQIGVVEQTYYRWREQYGGMVWIN